MGSKRKLSTKIIDFILERHPNTKYFYDLFGGGGAISFEAIQRPKIKQVFYNELNTGIVELLKKIKKDGVTKDFYQWIDRETFNQHKDDDDWFGGLYKTCWSFGNNQKDYLFGVNIEYDKKLLHHIVVDKCEKSLNIFNEKFKLSFNLDMFNYSDIQNRRLILTRYIKKHLNSENLDSISKIINIKNNSCRNMLERLQKLQKLEQLEQLQRLQQLQQLEQLQQLQQLQRLQITNLSYDEVNINTPIDETIIYLDPPYINTRQYQKNIDHNILYEYIKNSPYTIYMSSYDAPFDAVMSMQHNSTLSSTHNNVVIEKLYCNKGYIQSSKELILKKFFN